MDSEKADESDVRKHELDVARFEFEKQKHKLEELKNGVECFRARNEMLDRLISLMKYMNEIQDEVVVETTGVVTEKHILRRRVWNPHEEDIANACLRALKSQLQAIAEMK